MSRASFSNEEYEKRKLQAKKRYAKQLGWQFHDWTLGGVTVRSLRFGDIILHMPENEFKPRFYYWVSKSDFATAFEVPTTRLSHALVRLKPERPVVVEDDEYFLDMQYYNVRYQGTMYMEHGVLCSLLKELSSRRPYLNKLRVAYAEYLKTASFGKPHPDLEYFGRQGIEK